MRVDVKKVLFVGPKKLKDTFFEKAQEIGLVQFVEMGNTKQKQTPPEIDQLVHAIKILRGLPTLEQEETSRYDKANQIVETILGLHGKIDHLQEELRTLNLEIARVEVFGDFSLDDIQFIENEGKRALQFFFAKKGVVPEGEENLIFIRSDHGLDYYVSINPERRSYDSMIEMQVDQPLGTLRQRVSQIETEIHEIEAELKTYAKYKTFLHHALVQKMNTYHLVTAQDYATLALNDSLFAVEGWVPTNRFEDLEEAMVAMDVHMEEVAIDEEDVVPTCLQNEGVSHIGEDIIRIYDTPSTEDKDPSLWVLGFFALFFAMIMSDAGYGAIFLGIALYFRWKYPAAKGLGRRMLNLFTILSTACVVWGVLTNSFFGMEFAPDSPVRKVSVMQWLVEKRTAYHIAQQDETYQKYVEMFPNLQGVTDPTEFLKGGVSVIDGKQDFVIMNKLTDQIMMELALTVGVIHIILSLLRYLDRNWSGIGWVVFIIGCYLYFPEYLGATTMVHYILGVDPQLAALEGQYMIYGGLILAVGLAVIRHKLFGMIEIATIIQVFGDILSYLRLYALGLASAIISGVINDIASSIFLFAGIILVIVGHAVNMLLGVMGGVIHGLRLNFLEWYHYSFEGGGKPYDPLRKIEVD